MLVLKNLGVVNIWMKVNSFVYYVILFKLGVLKIIYFEEEMGVRVV